MGLCATKNAIGTAGPPPEVLSASKGGSILVRGDAFAAQEEKHSAKAKAKPRKAKSEPQWELGDVVRPVPPVRGKGVRFSIKLPGGGALHVQYGCVALLRRVGAARAGSSPAPTALCDVWPQLAPQRARRRPARRLRAAIPAPAILLKRSRALAARGVRLAGPTSGA